jgi:hypothetical protein
VVLPLRSGRLGVASSQATNPNDFQGLRARIVVAPDETVYVTLPESGAMSVVGPQMFPLLARDIPWPDIDAANAEGAPLEGVLRPAAPAASAQTAPVVLAPASSN